MSRAGAADLEWHQGTHAWLEHDAYRRHAHSANGLLTIDPHDAHPHFHGGHLFKPPAGEPAACIGGVADQPAAGFVPDEQHLDEKLSHLPDRLRQNPRFRQGYALGIRDLAFALRLTQRDRDVKPADPRPAPAARFGVTAGDLRGQLRTGDVVVRELLGLYDDAFATTTPCCGRMASVPRGEGALVVCCRCKLTATAAMTEEEPDGFSDEPAFVAVFTVTATSVVVAQHRTGRWER